MERRAEETSISDLEHQGRQLSHDLNNFLTVIKGNGEMLLESLAADDPRFNLAESVVEAVDKAARIARQFHTLIRNTGRPQANTARRPRILVADDDQAMRGLANRLLTKSGYAVLLAESGTEGLRITADNDIDLLVTDVFMLGMSGRELADSLRRRFPSLKVVFISGTLRHSLIEDGLLDARAWFLQKPFQLAALTEVVQSSLVDDASDYLGGD